MITFFFCIFISLWGDTCDTIKKAEEWKRVSQYRQNWSLVWLYHSICRCHFTLILQMIDMDNLNFLWRWIEFHSGWQIFEFCFWTVNVSMFSDTRIAHARMLNCQKYNSNLFSMLTWAKNTANSSSSYPCLCVICNLLFNEECVIIAIISPANLIQFLSCVVLMILPFLHVSTIQFPL